jgi:hypothetical protein
MKDIGIKLIVKNGELVPENKAEFLKLQNFKSSLKEGEILEMFINTSDKADKTLGQLAKVHVLISKLSTITGFTIDEMKQVVKAKANLYELTSEKLVFKSFANCSKEEISNAIKVCLSIGEDINHPLE